MPGIRHRKAALHQKLRDTPPAVRWPLAGIAALVAVPLLVWIVFQVLPDLFTPGTSKTFSEAKETTARADVRTSALQLLGGLFLLVGALYTAWTYRLNKEREITGRFTAAVDQLNHDQLAVRVGGIYALGRISVQSREYHDAVIQVITAFAMSHAPRPWSQPSPHIPLGLDIQAVASVLRDRISKYRRIEDRLELRDADLHRASLTRVDLTFAWLSNIDLRNARLVWAKLANARLGGADLRGALMAGADLQYAFLKDANLNGADLRGAKLRGADLTRTRARPSCDRNPIADQLWTAVAPSGSLWNNHER